MSVLDESPGPSANDRGGDARDELPSVLIVSDVRLYREGLATTLGDLGRLRIVGAVAGSDLSVACLSTLRPDVVLLDMALPGCLGLPAALHVEPAVKFIAFAVSEVGNEVLACAEAGISGYVGKDAHTEDLAATIEGTLRGEVLCPPLIVGTLFQRLAALVKLQAPQPSVAGLSVRQLEIIELIDQGHSNKEIAKCMRISVATVKNHIHNILDKLQVHRRAEAAAAIRSVAQAHREGPPSITKPAKRRPELSQP